MSLEGSEGRTAVAQSFAIDGRRIGRNHPPYVVAEMSANHRGSLEAAIELVNAAKESGADAVKLQTYTADTLTIDSDGDDFLIRGGLWDSRTLHDLYSEGSTPWEWHAELFRVAREAGITVFSSPFDFSAVEFLEELDAPAYKIASFEAVDLALIDRVARTGKPVIISTGLANVEEIEDAVEAARQAGCSDLALLHCVSAYPAPIEESHLRTIADMEERFGAVVGFSDHTPGVAVAIAAVALGASMIEKHLTLDRGAGGIDAAFSLEPKEFRSMAEGCRVAWTAAGDVFYETKPSERESLVFRRSLYVVEEIAAGDVLTSDNVRSIRPGYGLPPKYLDNVLGRRAVRDARRGTPLTMDLIEEDSSGASDSAER